MKAESTTIFLPRTVLETGADKDIEFEGTLADYLPGINRIVRAEANVMCEEAELKDGKAEIKGKAVFSLLYESDYKGKLKSERFQTDFSQRFDVGDLPDGNCYPIVNCRCSYVGCKTLNPRRFILRCRADIGLAVKCMQRAEIVSVADSKGAFFKEEKHTLWEHCAPIRRDFGIKENITLDALPPIGDIVYTSVRFLPAEVSLSDGNALVRCTGVFKCLYEEEGEEGALRYVEKSFPASFNIDDETIRKDSRVSVGVKCISAEGLKEMDGYGENRIISLNCSAAVNLECGNERTVTVPTDMFFEEYENENRIDKLACERQDSAIRHRFSLEKSFEVPELVLESCVDTNAEIQITEAVATESGISVKGNCGINILGKCSDGYRAHDISSGFSEEITFTPKDREHKLKASCEVISAAAEINSGKLNIRINAEIELRVIYKECFTALVSAEISKREMSEEDCEPMVIYYPEKGETAWDIGRRYHTDPIAIRKTNADVFDKDDRINTDGALLYM